MRGNDRGMTVAEMLVAAAVAALLAVVCCMGAETVARAVRAAETRLAADTLAEGAAGELKNQIRFARDPEETLRALDGYTAALGELSVGELRFRTDEDGTVFFRFRIADRDYEYKTTPLNWEYGGGKGE